MYSGQVQIVIVNRHGDLRLVRVPNRFPSFVLEKKTTDYMGVEKWDRTPEITVDMEHILEELVKEPPCPKT